MTKENKKGLLYYLLFTFTLLAKSYFARVSIFEDYNIGNTFIAELGGILFFTLLIEVIFKKNKFGNYIKLDIVYSLYLLVVIMYHSQFFKVINYHSLVVGNELPIVYKSVFALFKWRYIILWLDLIAMLLYKVIKGKSSKNDYTFNKKIIIGSFLAISLINGAVVQMQPSDTESNTVAKKIGLLNYQLYSVASRFNPVTSDNHLAFNANSINEAKDMSSTYNNDLQGVAKDKNIIVIQLESMQNFLINKSIDGKEITPNLNKLIKESLYFPNFFTQIGQGNTVDAEFMLNTSLYPMKEGIISKQKGNKQFPSLPKLLANEQYDSYTFHANDLSFYNRGEFYKSLGFNKAYGIEYFGDNDVVGIGPSDEYALSKIEKELKTLSSNNKKFYANIITLTGHSPFDIPQQKLQIKLPSKMKNTDLGKYIESQNYTDYALGKFIEGLEKNGILENSLLVIYGDHFGLPVTQVDKATGSMIKDLTKHEYDFIDMFNVPLLIRVPGGINRVIETTGGQIDLMPTIASLVGLDISNEIYFGRDIVTDTHNIIGLRYYFGEGSFIDNNIMYKSDGESIDIKTRNKSNTSKNIKTNNIKILQNTSDAYIESLKEYNRIF